MARAEGEDVFLPLYTARLKRMLDGSYAGQVVEGAIVGQSNGADDGFALITMRRIGN